MTTTTTTRLQQLCDRHGIEENITPASMTTRLAFDLAQRTGTSHRTWLRAAGFSLMNSASIATAMDRMGYTEWVAYNTPFGICVEEGSRSYNARSIGSVIAHIERFGSHNNR